VGGGKTLGCKLLIEKYHIGAQLSFQLIKKYRKKRLEGNVLKYYHHLGEIFKYSLQ
jgi:hypothetical protein